MFSVSGNGSPPLVALFDRHPQAEAEPGTPWRFALAVSLILSFAKSSSSVTARRPYSGGRPAIGGVKTGEQSLLTWIRKEYLTALKAADSWDAFHRVLAEAGVVHQAPEQLRHLHRRRREAGKGERRRPRVFKERTRKTLRHVSGNARRHQRRHSAESYQRNPLEASPEAKTAFAQAKERSENRRTERVASIRNEQQSQVSALMAEIKNDRLQARRTYASRPAKKKLYEAINLKYHAKLAGIRKEVSKPINFLRRFCIPAFSCRLNKILSSLFSLSRLSMYLSQHFSIPFVYSDLHLILRFRRVK